MSEHHATVVWQRQSSDFKYENYNRTHEWRFDETLTVSASSSPEFRGIKETIDPEKALVASLASCHMLTFLAMAARRGMTVEAYEDHAVGIMAKNEAGKLAVTKVTLRPYIRFAIGVSLAPSDLEKWHHQAHEDCFIANSVKTEVVVEPQTGE